MSELDKKPFLKEYFLFPSNKKNTCQFILKMCIKWLSLRMNCCTEYLVEKNDKDLLYEHKSSRLGSAGMEMVVTGPGGWASRIF